MSMNSVGMVYTTVINLKRSPERRAYMEHQLDACRIPFVLLEATDGSVHTFDSHDSTSLSGGELGCALSHRRALQAFLESSAPYALIMEDDIDISDRFSAVLSTILRMLDAKTPHYIQFDYAPVGWRGVQFWWFLFLTMVRTKKTEWRFWIQMPWYLIKGVAANIFSLYEGVRNWFFKKSASIAPARKDRYLAGCYLVTRETARVLITLNTPIQHAADAVHNVARRKHLIEHYIAIPRVVRQKRESFHSTLEDIHFGKKIISY